MEGHNECAFGISHMFEGMENGGLLWNGDFCLTYQQKPMGKRDTVSTEQVVLLHTAQNQRKFFFFFGLKLKCVIYVPLVLAKVF